MVCIALLIVHSARPALLKMSFVTLDLQVLMMEYTHPSFVKNDDKVEFIYKFVADLEKHDTDCFLVIVGACATGKSHALNAAIDRLEKEAKPYRVMVWNEQERPYYRESKNSKLGADCTAWIMIRRQEDALSVAFQNEWNHDSQYYCQAVKFVADPEHVR